MVECNADEDETEISCCSQSGRLPWKLGTKNQYINSP